MWDVTIPYASSKVFCLFLLTHPVWDVTESIRSFRKALMISTHTSRVGCDPTVDKVRFRREGFLLTHPVWDVTEHSHQVWNYHGISTHTSRVGCDSICSSDICHPNNFYSHIPCGMWPKCFVCFPQCNKFLLTHPVWDVTIRFKIAIEGDNISTHTSRVGCDMSSKLL